MTNSTGVADRSPLEIPPVWQDSDVIDQLEAKLCCCPPTLYLSGNVEEVRTIGVGAEAGIDQVLGTSAVTSGELAPGRQPSANFDASARIGLEHRFEKPKDCVLLTVCYEIVYAAADGCGPYRIAIYTGGDVESEHQCLVAPQTCGIETGSVKVSKTTLFKGDEYAGRARGGLRVRGFVVDCQQIVSSTALFIPAP